MNYQSRGIDPNKMVNGSKRQIIIDTGDQIWYEHGHSAGIADCYRGLGLSEDFSP